MEGLLWLLIWGALFYLMMRFGCGSHMVHGHGHRGHGPVTGGPEGNGSPAAFGAKDPVCGMDVATDSGYSRMYKGREYRFCSRQCLDRFDASPATYTG